MLVISWMADLKWSYTIFVQFFAVHRFFMINIVCVQCPVDGGSTVYFCVQCASHWRIYGIFCVQLMGGSTVSWLKYVVLCSVSKSLGEVI